MYDFGRLLASLTSMLKYQYEAYYNSIVWCSLCRLSYEVLITSI